MRQITPRVILFFFLLVSHFSNAQDKEKEDEPHWTTRLVYGGGATAQFGTVTAVGASPFVGYRVTERFIPGISVQYLYYSVRQSGFSDSRYGGSIFSRYFISQTVFAHAEYELMNLSLYRQGVYPPVLEKKWITSFMVGGGLYYPIGPRSGFSVMALYILNHDPVTSPHGNSPLVIRAGFMF